MILGASNWIIRNISPGFSRGGLAWLMIHPASPRQLAVHPRKDWAQLTYTQVKTALLDILLQLRNCLACFFYHVHEDLFGWTAFVQHASDLP